MGDSGEYVVYVDESGDHSLTSIDEQYPVFVLAYCIFEKSAYIEEVVPAVQSLKFEHFGHDVIILHEREIRKAKPPFEFLVDEERREHFLTGLTALIEGAPFTLIATCIDKHELTRRYAYPENPYNLALAYGLERLWMFLCEREQQEAKTHIVFECRGKQEDRDLELEFRTVCSGKNYAGDTFPFEIVFADKRTNSSGLQLADMVARPIGRHVIDPEQPNRAFDILWPKFHRKPDGTVEGCGLKCFP